MAFSCSIYHHKVPDYSNTVNIIEVEINMFVASKVGYIKVKQSIAIRTHINSYLLKPLK